MYNITKIKENMKKSTNKKTKKVKKLSPTKTFTQISENNDWEGEEWNFFLDNSDPLTAKVVELTKKLSQDEEYEDAFKVVNESIDETTVKVLLKKKSVATYMNDYNLVKQIKPEILTLESKTPDEVFGQLYKGGLFKCA